MVVRRLRRPLDASKLRPAAVDLFGEVPISRREVMLWMWRVPAWMNRDARPAKIADYIRCWDVPAKIRREKLANTLANVFGDESCPHCGTLLEANYPARIEELQAEVESLRATLAAIEDRRQIHAAPPLRLVA